MRAGRSLPARRLGADRPAAPVTSSRATPIAALLLAIVCAMTLTACGGSSPTRAASIASPTTTTTAASAPTPSAPAPKASAKKPRTPAPPPRHPQTGASRAHHRRKPPSSIARVLRRFTACMRAHGVPAFPQAEGETFDPAGAHIDTAARCCRSA